MQLVYVLEVLRGDDVIRGHFAQSLGAAQRAAAGKYGLRGLWEAVQGGATVSRLLGPGGQELARVRREQVQYG